jgi:ketosteroid isomerase-like protein
MSDAKAVLRKFHDMVSAGAFEDWAEVIDEHFVFRLPYAPPGIPQEMHGLTARDALLKSRAGQDYFRWKDVTILATEDPELLVGTARSEVQMKSGRPYGNSYVTLTRVRDGRIVEHTEYFNPLLVLESLAP